MALAGGEELREPLGEGGLERASGVDQQRVNLLEQRCAGEAPVGGRRDDVGERLAIRLAIPFFTAYIFYNWLGISQYPLLRLNVLVGTLLSYAILRNPTTPGNYHPRLTGITILFFSSWPGVFSALNWSGPMTFSGIPLTLEMDCALMA